jgi:cholesterol oxidase
MRGHVGFGAPDYASGEAQGKLEHTRFEHEVLIQMLDIYRFVSEPKHAAPMTGHVMWQGERIDFTGGEFNMLVDSVDPRVSHMFYRIPFGKLTMLGHKQLVDDAGPDVLHDITTLYIQIYDREVPGHDFTRPETAQPEWPPNPIARGIIHIPISDGINSALSFVAPGSSRVQKLVAIEKFLKFYGSHLYSLYLKQNDIKREFLAIAVATGVMFVAALLIKLL